MNIKCKLRVILAEKEIKHGEFAKRVGISQASLSSLVNNRSLPKFEAAYKIAQELKMPIEEIWIRKEG